MDVAASPTILLKKKSFLGDSPRGFDHGMQMSITGKKDTPLQQNPQKQTNKQKKQTERESSKLGKKKKTR